MKKNRGEKKILFLDFDGVLNNVGFFLSPDFKGAGMLLGVKETFKNHMDIHNVRLLNYILKEVPELEIIISSSWGMAYRLPEIRKGLKYAGLKKEYAKRVIGITPRKMSSYRCNEVVWAVRDLIEEGWKCEKWLTLDDHHIFPDTARAGKGDIFDESHREIRTSKLHGLTIGDAWQIIRYFKPDFVYPEVNI